MNSSFFVSKILHSRSLILWYLLAETYTFFESEHIYRWRMCLLLKNFLICESQSLIWFPSSLVTPNLHHVFDIYILTVLTTLKLILLGCSMKITINLIFVVSQLNSRSKATVILKFPIKPTTMLLSRYLFYFPTFFISFLSAQFFFFLWIVCSTYITSSSSSSSLNDQVKTTSPKKYFVRPNTGVIQPWDSCIIRGFTLITLF